MKPTGRSVLYPTDFSRASARVFDEASRLARASRAALLIVHVVTPDEPPLTGEGGPGTGEFVIDESMHGRAKRRLDGLVAEAHRARARASGLLLEGDPADEIVRAATSSHADVIVMSVPRRRRAALTRLVFDSITDRVIARAPCPVLTYHDTRQRKGSARAVLLAR